MPNATKIEWVPHVWNPITGCPGPKISEGCAHCYAERMAVNRLRGRMGYDSADPFKITYHRDRYEQFLMRRKHTRVFVNSMGDLFHPDVDQHELDCVFAAMLCSEITTRPSHEFLILTKRPDAMAAYFAPGPDTLLRRWGKAGNGWLHVGKGDELFSEYADGQTIPQEMTSTRDNLRQNYLWPLPNVWLGVTVCNQAEADAKIPLLLQTPAAKRFVSVEPMLGQVDLTAINCREDDAEWRLNALTAEAWCENSDSASAYCDYVDGVQKLDWVICGGETGPGARPMHPDWVRSLRDQCQCTDVPFFFKSWGEWLPTDSVDFYRGEHNVDFVQKYGRTGREFPNSEGCSIIRDGRVLLVDPPLKVSNTFCEKYKLPSNYKPDGRNLLIDVDAHSYAHKCGLHKVGYQWMYCVGKKRAGRLLDGREWNEIPEARLSSASVLEEMERTCN